MFSVFPGKAGKSPCLLYQIQTLSVENRQRKLNLINRVLSCSVCAASFSVRFKLAYGFGLVAQSPSAINTFYPEGVEFT